MEFSTLIFLVIAVIIFMRLRSQLGKRTGLERTPEERSKAEMRGLPGNVTPLPTRKSTPVVVGAEKAKADQPLESTQPIVENVKDLPKEIAQPGSPLAQALDFIRNEDKSFDARHFLSGAKAAYEMIIKAFAAGERTTLKKLLSPDVYEGFEDAISDREAAGEKVESHFIGFNKADITEAVLKDRTAQITVSFISKLVQATRDSGGTIIDGDPVEVTEVHDVWTFERDISARDPNWRVASTQGA